MEDGSRCEERDHNLCEDVEKGRKLRYCSRAKPKSLREEHDSPPAIYSEAALHLQHANKNLERFRTKDSQSRRLSNSVGRSQQDNPRKLQRRSTRPRPDLQGGFSKLRRTLPCSKSNCTAQSTVVWYSAWKGGDRRHGSFSHTTAQHVLHWVQFECEKR